MSDLAPLLAQFHAVMPHVAGVVLADAAGRALATDARAGVDADGLAARGRAAMSAGCSALVDEGGASYLVVVLP